MWHESDYTGSYKSWVMANSYQQYLSSLPWDWDVRQVEDLGQVISGGTPNRNIPTYWAGDIPWVAPAEMANLAQKYLHDTQENITEAGLKSSGATLLPSDALLVTTRATIGLVALAGTQVATNQGFKSVVLNDGSDPSFYYHLFHQLTSELTRLASGTTFLEISRREFASIKVPVPPYGEQRRIAEILDTIDEAIRQTERVIEKLQQVKQGLLHDLLTRGIDENGELRDPERHPEQFKDSPLGTIPKEWSVRTCGDVCSEIVVGIVIKPSQYYRPSGIPVLRSANVRENFLDLTDLAYMSENDHASMRKSAVRPGDIVTVRTGYPGMTSVVPHHLKEANTVDIIVSRPAPGIDAPYLSMWINSEFGRGQILRGQGGLAQQHFNISQMRKLLIAVPSRREQAEITKIMHGVHARLRQERRSVQKLYQLKQGVMNDLLTGRVRVPVPEGATV